MALLYDDFRLTVNDFWLASSGNPAATRPLTRGSRNRRKEIAMAISPASTTVRPSTALPGSTNYSAMAMVTTLFFTWGFCTVLNDAVIPHLQSIFQLSYLQASLIQLAFFSSYFL